MQLLLLEGAPSFDLTGWLSVGLAFFALVAAVFIPIQIMKYQRYTNLAGTYMSCEVAHAIQNVIDFFHDTCNCDVERIPDAYKKRFYSDRAKLKNKEIDINGVLHYQRRLLNDYFLELEMCRESSIILRKIISKNWTTSEAWICKVLIYMNVAVDNDRELYKDISSIKHEKMPKTKGFNNYLKNFYNAQRAESRFMQV